MTEEPPAKVLDFFATARDARRADLTRGKISPSREQPKFRTLYGSVNKPYLDVRPLVNKDYGPRNDGPGVA
jgi:hypothetical protein